MCIRDRINCGVIIVTIYCTAMVNMRYYLRLRKMTRILKLLRPLTSYPSTRTSFSGLKLVGKCTIEIECTSWVASTCNLQLFMIMMAVRVWKCTFSYLHCMHVRMKWMVELWNAAPLICCLFYARTWNGGIYGICWLILCIGSFLLYNHGMVRYNLWGVGKNFVPKILKIHPDFDF